MKKSERVEADRYKIEVKTFTNGVSFGAYIFVKLEMGHVQVAYGIEARFESHSAALREATRICGEVEARYSRDGVFPPSNFFRGDTELTSNPTINELRRIREMKHFGSE